MRTWIDAREPASWDEDGLLAFFGHRAPVDPEALRGAIERKRRHWRHQESGRNPTGRRIAADVLERIEQAGSRLAHAHPVPRIDWRGRPVPASSRRHDLLAYFGVTTPSDLPRLDERIAAKRAWWAQREGPTATTAREEIATAAAALDRSGWVDEWRPVSSGRSDLAAFLGLPVTADPDRVRHHAALKRAQWTQLQRASVDPRDRRRAVFALAEIARAEVDLVRVAEGRRRRGGVGSTRRDGAGSARRDGAGSGRRAGVAVLGATFAVAWTAAVVITALTRPGVVNPGHAMVVAAAAGGAVLLRRTLTGWPRAAVGATTLVVVVWWVLALIGPVLTPRLAPVAPAAAVVAGLAALVVAGRSRQP